MDKANRKRKKNSLVLELIMFKEFIILNGFSVNMDISSQTLYSMDFTSSLIFLNHLFWN